MVACGVKKRETKSTSSPRSGDDDAAVAEVDLVELGAVDGDRIDGRLVRVDEDVIAGFQDFGGGVVQRLGDGFPKARRAEEVARAGPFPSCRRWSCGWSGCHWRN